MFVNNMIPLLFMLVLILILLIGGIGYYCKRKKIRAKDKLRDFVKGFFWNGMITYVTFIFLNFSMNMFIKIAEIIENP